MADVAITPITLVMNAASADHADADGTAITTANANVFAIAAGGKNGDRLLLKFVADASGDTVTILKGDRPPSQRKDLGDLSFVLAASDVKYIPVEAARFLQDDGTIRATCLDDGTKCSAFIMPKGLTGGSA